MISDKLELIFIHIPKCGGTSIESIFWSKEERVESNLWMGFIDKYHNKFQTGGLQHLKATQIRLSVGDEKFNAYLKFSVVRNPYDRAVSQYIYMQSRPDLRDFVGMKKNDGFVDYLYKINHISHVQWESQFSFLHDNNGKCLADLIVKLENINVLPSILKSYPLIPAFDAVPKVNSNPLYDKKNYLSNEAKSLIMNKYSLDFKTFNYPH